MPTPTPRRPPAVPPPAAPHEAAPAVDDAGHAPLAPAAADLDTPAADDSVEDWYFCGEGSLYR